MKAKFLATLGLSASLLLVGPAIARADEATDSYVAKHGQSVCDALEKGGVNYPTIQKIAGQLLKMGFTEDQAVSIFSDSVLEYCPQQYGYIVILAQERKKIQGKVV